MGKTYWEQYREKLVTAEQAAAMLKSNDSIFYGSFLGRPIDFDIELAKRKEELYDVDIRNAGGLLPVQQTALCDPSHEHFICNSWYYGAIDRKLSDNSKMFYIPAHFSQSEDMLIRHCCEPDFYVQQVSSMDDYGMFHFGLTNTYSLEGIHQANKQGKIVILEVNENMPRVPGGSENAVHISRVDYVIEGSNTELFELPPSPEPSELDRTMAQLILEEIPDYACLQLGIGTLPNVLGKLMCDSDLKHLGIHTEMFVDSMIELFDAGIVTNMYKNIDRGKMAFTFCLGSKNTYDFMDQNALMASYSSRYTNDPRIICQNDKVISINSALKTDLFSQISAESSGTRHISGTGGQVDFVQGAWFSKGGKSFLCLPSTYTDKQGKLHSNIVPTLEPGAIVTTSRTFVDYIVTEYGKAQLKGMPTWMRAETLINLAHPDFRDELIQSAHKMNIWRRTNKVAL